MSSGGIGKMATSSDSAANQKVLAKLVVFSLLMALAPIGTYFSSLWYLFEGNSTFSAIAAVVVANLVLVGYVTVAFREDAAERAATKLVEKNKQAEKKKN